MSDAAIRVRIAGKDITDHLQFRFDGLQALVIEPALGFAFTPTCFCAAPRTVVGIYGSPFRCACGRPWRWIGDTYGGGFWQTDAREWPDQATPSSTDA